MLNKSIFSILTVCFLFLSFQSHAKIIETNRFADILSEVDHPNTLVFVDIDDTLINTVSILGNTAWWDYFISKILKANLPLDKVQVEINGVIQKIIKKVPMNLIEPDTSDVIRKLQQDNFLIFALTARQKKADYIDGADRETHEHLNSVGIDFTLTSISQQINDAVAAFFSYGIIFTGWHEKGPVLKIFLKEMELNPGKIVFIDDKLEQIKSVEKAAKSMGIPFSGFRYGKLDDFHQQFDPLIANIQLEALIKNDQILSNEEARKIAHIHPRHSPHYFIDELIHSWTR